MKNAAFAQRFTFLVIFFCFVLMVSLVNFIKYLRKNNTNFSQAISVSRGGETISHLILWGWYYPATKARQTYFNKTPENYLSGIDPKNP